MILRQNVRARLVAVLPFVKDFSPFLAKSVELYPSDCCSTLNPAFRLERSLKHRRTKKCVGPSCLHSALSLASCHGRSQLAHLSQFDIGNMILGSDKIWSSLISPLIMIIAVMADEFYFWLRESILEKSRKTQSIRVSRSTIQRSQEALCIHTCKYEVGW